LKVQPFFILTFLILTVRKKNCFFFQIRSNVIIVYTLQHPAKESMWPVRSEIVLVALLVVTHWYWEESASKKCQHQLTASKVDLVMERHQAGVDLGKCKFESKTSFQV